MENITLQADAIIGGRYYPAGTEIMAGPEAVAAGIGRAARQNIRATITAKVGDTPSLLGTQADVLGLVLVHLLADIIAISDDPGNDGQRKRLEIMQGLAGDADIKALAETALARITSGEAILTASLKGLESVIDETLTRSTATAKVLIAALEG